MSKADKKLKAMKSNPKDDWKIDDLKSIARNTVLNTGSLVPVM